MEIKIGMDNVGREVSLDSTLDTARVFELVEAAISSGELLRLEDRKGNKVLIPGSKIAYVEIGSDSSRPVGFGAL
jgi:hypothetical protein